MTKEALEGSIAVWKRRAAGEYIPPTPIYCPLCSIYNTEDMSVSKSCSGCPVMKVTDLRWCVHTPYQKYTPRESGRSWPDYASSDEGKAAAQKEVEFLESLRSQYDA